MKDHEDPDIDAIVIKMDPAEFVRTMQGSGEWDHDTNVAFCSLMQMLGERVTRTLRCFLADKNSLEGLNHVDNHVCEMALILEKIALVIDLKLKTGRLNN